MTLEDFFTLTEMKDGLTAHTRVEELVAIMQKEKECVLKNVGEAARQWSTVAGTLAATENKDCLDHFVQLDGLLFLNRWIEEAQNCSNDMSDGFVEESMTALLGALEKLPIDWEKTVSSGIEASVKNLFGHKSSRIQDMAKALYDSWNQGRGRTVDHWDFEKGVVCRDKDVSAIVELDIKSGSPKQYTVDVSPLKENADAIGHEVKLAGGEVLELRNSDVSDVSKLDRFKDVHCMTYNSQDASCTTSGHKDKDDALRDGQNSSIMLNHGEESLSLVEEVSVHPTEGTTSTGAYSCPVTVKGDVECKALDNPKLGDVRERDTLKGCLDKCGVADKSHVSSTSGHECASSTTDPANAQESMVEPCLQNDVGVKQSDFCPKNMNHLGLDTDECSKTSNQNKGAIDCSMLNHSRNKLKLKSKNQDGECYPIVLRNFTSNSCNSRMQDGPETSFSRMEDIGAVIDVKRLSSESTIELEGEDLTFTADISKPMMVSKDSDKINKELNMELEYGDNALEVAWKVAKEVEQEVGDYREPSCSSEKNSGGVQQPDSPGSINGEQDLQINGSVNNVPIGQNLSIGSSRSKGEERLMGSEDMDTKPEDCMQDIESSQVTEAAQEPASKTMKTHCVFDLNAEVHSEEMDQSTTPISAPISVTAASRAAAAPGLPVAPLQFEGAQGWKGSAATSAFRPASPRRIPDGNKTMSIEGSSHSSKQRQDFLLIDLNVAGSDDAVPGPTTREQMPVSSGLPSGESSIEVSSKRAAVVKFDLNRVGDNDDSPSLDWGKEGQPFGNHRNGHRSPSPASSSSSRPPYMRNFDLNDCPTLIDDYHHQRPDIGKLSSYGLQKQKDPVISIMGTKVEVGGGVLIPQTQSFLQNGLFAESSMGVNPTRTMGGLAIQPPMTFTSSPVFGFNGLAIGPSMYGPGPIPYMVDSRGEPLLPQIIGPAPAVPASNSRPSFLMGMAGQPSVLNESGPTRPDFDINSGWMMTEGGSRESEGLRQLLIQEPGALMEGHMRYGLHSSTSGTRDKRKEPEGGWEPYSFVYKQQPPRWQ